MRLLIHRCCIVLLIASSLAAVAWSQTPTFQPMMTGQKYPRRN